MKLTNADCFQVEQIGQAFDVLAQVAKAFVDSDADEVGVHKLHPLLTVTS